MTERKVVAILIREILAPIVHVILEELVRFLVDVDVADVVEKRADDDGIICQRCLRKVLVRKRSAHCGEIDSSLVCVERVGEKSALEVVMVVA